MEDINFNGKPDLAEDDFNSDFIEAFYELDKKMSGHSDEPASRTDNDKDIQSVKDVKPLSNQKKGRHQKENRASDAISTDNTSDGAGAIKASVFISPTTYFKLSIIKGLTKKSLSKIIGRGIDLVIAEYAENNSEVRKYLSK